MNNTEIIEYVKEITPDKENLPDYFIALLEDTDAEFRLETVSISDVLKTDEGVRDYVNSKEQRYGDVYDHDEYWPEEEEVYSPIVILDDEVLDGYNRTSTLYWNGEMEIEAYVGYSSGYIGKRRFENMIITLESFRKTVKENREWKEVVELSVNDRVLSGEATLRDIFDYFEPDLGESDIFSGHEHTVDFSTLYEYTVDIDNGSLTINDLDITVKYDIGLSDDDVRGIHKRLAAKENILVNYTLSEKILSEKILSEKIFVELNKKTPQEWNMVEWSIDGVTPSFIGQMYYQNGTGLMFIEQQNGQIYKPKSKLFWRPI